MEGPEYTDILGQETVDAIRDLLINLRNNAEELMSVYLGIPFEYSAVQDMIQEGDWIVDYDEYDLLQFIVALSRVATTLREEIFEESLKELCEVLVRYV